MSGVSYVRFYPSNWRSGCIGLSLEQQGLYIAICTFRWETGRLVPIDRSTAARMLMLNRNKYEKVLNELLRLGKLYETAAGLVNDRAEAEYQAAEQAAGKAERRQADQGRVGQTRHHTLGVTPPITPTHAPPAMAGKVVANQGAFIERDKDKDKIKDSLPATVEQDAAGGPKPDDEISGLNGATAEIVRGVAKLLNVYAPDFETAKRIVQSNVGLYGPVAVRDGYAEFCADRDDGKVGIPTSKTLVGYFRTAADRGRKLASPGAQAPWEEARERRHQATRELIASLQSGVVQ